MLLSKTDSEECLLPLLNEDEDIRQGIDVVTYTMRGKEYPMMLIKRRFSRNFFLADGWIEVEEFITIWMFGHVKTKQLCFVISKSPDRINFRGF